MPTRLNSAAHQRKAGKTKRSASLVRARTSRPIGFPCRQQGQVIPFTLVFISAVILGLWVMYDSGEIQTEKIKLQNTADNVAYSGAALMARDLNFAAYTNRAMVANQVAIGQMVGLSSYAVFLKRTVTNIDYVASLFPPLKAVTAVLQQFASALSTATDQFTGQLVIPASEHVNRELSFAQGQYHRASLLAASQVSAAIGRRNDPDAVPFLTMRGIPGVRDAAAAYAQWAAQIGDQNELHSTSDSSSRSVAENARFSEFGRRLVSDSRDGFSRHRSYDWFHVNFGVVAFEARKNGGAGLKRARTDDYYHWDWSSMDTLGVYEKTCTPFGCSWDGDRPVGWGAAHAVNADHGEGDRYQYWKDGNLPDGEDRDNAWGGAWRNDNAAGLAAGEFQDHNLSYISRFQPFYAFRDDNTNHDYGPATMAVYIKNDSDISSERNTLAHVAPAIDTQGAGGLQNHRISAAAKARPYFARSTDLESFARSDGRFEHGNLFNPFWQPRLVELTPAEKQQIAGVLAATP